MRITKKLLEEKNACAEGLACFNAAFHKGIDLKDWTVEKQIEVLRSDLRVYIGWAFERGIIPLWSMQGANLGGANLEGANLGGAKYDKYTIFPAGFDAKEKGAWIVG